MQLLHHWTRRVILFHNPILEEDKWIWREAIVEIAFQNPFLLHGILALAALHKTVVDSPQNRASLLAQADMHMSAALATYLRLIEESAPETAVPCFLLSSICLAYNLATAQVEEPEDPIHAILHCFRLLRGIKVVIGQHWDKLQQNDIVKKLIEPINDLKGFPTPVDVECIPLLELKQLTEQLELEEPTKSICLEALDDLHQISVKTTLCSSGKNEHSVVMTW